MEVGGKGKNVKGRSLLTKFKRLEKAFERL